MNKPKTGKSRTNCSVAGCHSRSGKDRTIGFHNYPEFGKTTVVLQLKTGVQLTMDRRRAWEYILRDGQRVTKYGKVCSLHFQIDDYILPSVVRRKALKTIAVPSLNLPRKKIRDKVEKSVNTPTGKSTFEFIDVNNMQKPTTKIKTEYSEIGIKKEPDCETDDYCPNECKSELIKVENDLTNTKYCDYKQIKSEFVPDDC